MEGEDLNCLYQILESSSSHFWPPLNSVHSFFTPQICFTNPQNGAVENLNFNSVEQRASEKRGKQKKQKKKSKEKATWYKGPWTKTEDRKLCRLVLHYGRGQWASIAQHMSGRIGKQCRERYHNNLFPNIKKSRVWSEEEEMMIIEGHKKFGNRWSAIAKFLPGRSENAVKNHWNSIKRRQFSTKQIARPHALHESKLLEDYIKKKFFNHRKTTPSAAVAPPAFIITTAAAAASSSPAFTITTDTRPPPIGENDAPAAFLQPPLVTVDENNDLVTSFSAATLAPPPITENYDAVFPSFSTTAATFTPPPSITITENSNEMMETTFCSSAAYVPPPIAENYDALMETNPPLSVDDYDTDGVPYFSFEGAVNQSSELALPYFNAIDEDHELMLPCFTSESVIDEDLDFMHSHNMHSGDGRIHPSPFTGDADDSAGSISHFAAETAVDEEMGCLRSIFGSNGEIIIF